MKIVLDTNVLVAAFISHGGCHELLEHCVRNHQLVSSELLLEELRDTLQSKFYQSEQDVAETIALLRPRVQIVQPASLPVPVSRDPDDDLVLATALASRSTCIISGDKDLLVIGHYAGIPILPPKAFWEFEARMLAR